MNSSGAKFVGVAVGGDGPAAPMQPIKLERESVVAAENLTADTRSPLLDMTEDEIQCLTEYLVGRLNNGSKVRDRRVRRYGKIDQSISTWQKLDSEDSKRKLMEEVNGKAQSIPFNLPILASQLDDMTSYFAEALAPVSNPFFSSSGDEVTKQLLDKLNRDALRRDYYGELAKSIRALLKYNTGGIGVEWDEGSDGSKAALAAPGNRWSCLDMYNTLWDPSIKDPSKVSEHAEWAATVCITNRLKLIRKTLAGDWVGLEKILTQDIGEESITRLYRTPAFEANISDDGQDVKTAAGKSNQVNWSDYGLGYSTDLGPEVDGFEETRMYCWLIPEKHGLLSDAQYEELRQLRRDPDSYLELWQFTLINGCRLVEAKPVIPRADATQGEPVMIPMFLTFLTNDQLAEAQRSFMELMKGFQGFASSMFRIYQDGMRKGVYGITAYDPQMFDAGQLSKGEVVGMLASKQPGRDVRTGLSTLNESSGTENAMRAVGESLQLKDSMFPAQALPSQIAGIDRAVKSQVTTVIQGSQRKMRMLLRYVDSNLMLGTRMQAFRNLKRWDKSGIEDVDDEAVAKLIGSGIESMEAERVADALWQLVYAIIQNQEAMARFDVPQLLTYIGRVTHLSVDLGQFARLTPEEQAQQAQQQGQGQGQGQPVPAQ